MTIPLLRSIATLIVNPLIKLLIGLALVVFLWGVAQFIYGAGEDKTREEGKKHIIWGLVGLFIMVSAIGIENLICKAITAC